MCQCLNSVLNVCEGTSSLYRVCEIFTNIHLKLYPGPGPPSRCCTSSSSSSSAGSSWSPACRPRPARPPQCPRPAAARCPCGGGGGWSPSRVTCHVSHVSSSWSPRYCCVCTQRSPRPVQCVVTDCGGAYLAGGSSGGL